MNIFFLKKKSDGEQDYIGYFFWSSFFIWYSGGNFELDWDISEKLDGWLEVRVLGCSLDQYFDDFGKSHKFSIRVNNQPILTKAKLHDKTWIGSSGKLYTFTFK